MESFFLICLSSRILLDYIVLLDLQDYIVHLHFPNLHVSRKLLHFPHTYYCLAIILYGCILFLLWVLFVVIFFFFFFFLMEGATLIGSSPNFRELWAIPHQSIPLILPSQNRSIIASIVMLPIYPLYKLYIFMKVEL